MANAVAIHRQVRARVLSRFHEKLRPDKLSKCSSTVPRTLLSLGAHIEFDTRHKSADDFTGYTTTSILSSHFHRTSVTSMPCFIRACDGCCTNVFIRLNSRVQGFSEIAEQWPEEVDEPKGGSKRERGRGTPGSGMKRIAPGLCSRFLARRRTCSHISNRVLSSPLRHGPLLTLPSANSLTYAGTYVYSCTNIPYEYECTLRPCDASRRCTTALDIGSVHSNLVNRYIV